MNILVDMNLSPSWCAALARYGIEAKHWSSVGAPNAPDHELMAWADTNGYVVFTNDLDLGAILANSSAEGPSVIQVRAQALLPKDLEVVVAALKRFANELEAGALIVVDPSRTRVRLLPLRRRSKP